MRTTSDHETSGSERLTTSVGSPGSGAAPGLESRTYPAPARIAAAVARRAAPVMPGEPATMATAACHLCESTARGSSHCHASSSVTRWAAARG